MLSYDRAIEIVSDYISDMPWKERRSEIEWMLRNAYKKDTDMDVLIEEWDLENRNIWKIKEYIDEENTD